MINLSTPEQYEAMLAATGFTSIEVEDITDLAEDCFEKIHAASQQQKAAIVSAVGAPAQQSWMEVADLYRQSFKERRFCYTRISARWR